MNWAFDNDRNQIDKQTRARARWAVKEHPKPIDWTSSRRNDHGDSVISARRLPGLSAQPESDVVARQSF